MAKQFIPTDFSHMTNAPDGGTWAEDSGVTIAGMNNSLTERLLPLQIGQQRIADRMKYDNDQTLARTAADTSRDNSVRQQQADVQGSANRLVGEQGAQRVTSEGNQLQSSTSLANNDRNAGVAERGNQLGAETARRGQDLSLQASMAPINFARERFDRIMPLVDRGFSETGPGGTGSRDVGGTNTQPKFEGRPVYSPGETQEQVNSERATIGQQAQTQMVANARSAGGRGFGGNSPLLMALNNQVQGMATAAGADAERQVRFDAAGANAKQQLGYDTLAVEQADRDNRNDIGRRQVTGQQRSSLLQILAGLA